MAKHRCQVGDDHLRAIGLVTVQFSRLEFTLSMLIGKLLTGDDKVMEIVFGSLSFGRSLGLLLELCQHKTPQCLDAFREFAKMARASEEKRNQISHSAWGFSEEEGKVARYKPTRTKKEDMSVKDIEDIADFLADTQAEAFKMFMLLLKAEKTSN